VIDAMTKILVGRMSIRCLFLLCFAANVFIVNSSVDAQMPDNVGDDFANVNFEASIFDDWRKHILPDESELAWKKIPWLSTFQQGILEGSKQNKPVLLWTMNGHPLGCT
jgi:hypothetical protein